MKKVLIITYYWPPSGGVGVQRWLKFAKYLPENGWEPIIFTPENPEFGLNDESLFKDISSDLEVVKFPIWEPFGIYKKLFGKTTKSSLKQGIVIEKTKLTLGDKLSIWIRANFFIPDPRRFWVGPSVNFLKRFIDDNDINYIITTGPPHSVHLIGLGLKKHHPNIKWLADFRDPWSDWDVLNKLKISKWAYNIHKKLEFQVIGNADSVITVSKRLALALSQNNSQEVSYITNGLDEDDFEVGKSENPLDKFRITYTGLLNEMRNPENLWLVLKQLCNENKEFKDDLEITLAGVLSSSISDNLLQGSLSENVVLLDYIPHSEVVKLLNSSSLMLLILNNTPNAKWILPVKFFEYLFTGKPILCLGSKDSDLYDIIQETNSGHLFELNETIHIKRFILEKYDDFKKGIHISQKNQYSKYTRKNLTKELANLLNNLN